MVNPVLHTIIGNWRWHEQWLHVGKPSPEAGWTRKTHGIAISRKGQIILFHQANPSILILDQDAGIVDSWGRYSGAHGLTLVEENGEEVLWLTDERAGLVEKRTLNGELLQSVVAPVHPLYQDQTWRPTWVAVNEAHCGGNEDIWVADGYGAGLIHRFRKDGTYLNTIAGTPDMRRFHCPHGIWFDRRKRPAELYVADRGNHRVLVFDSEGRFCRSVGSEYLSSPDGFAPLGRLLLVPELMGRMAVLNEQDELVTYIGANEEVCGLPGWPDEVVPEPGRFCSPHAACADECGNIYVVEWRIGGRVIKLERISCSHDDNGRSERRQREIGKSVSAFR